MKKGWGRLIHVLDFIEEENGRLIIRNEEGVMVKDARCIMYPRSDGNAWWDYMQLLAQVDWAILIFEEAHPKCARLFCSTTHPCMPRSDPMHFVHLI